MQLAIIAAIVTAIVGVLFAMQNNVAVTVNVLLWRFDSSLAMVLLVSLALGALAVALLTTPGALKNQWQAARLKRRIATLEDACEHLCQRVAELESSGPAPASTREEPPYVGLKQLITGVSEKEPPQT